MGIKRAPYRVDRPSVRFSGKKRDREGAWHQADAGDGEVAIHRRRFWREDLDQEFSSHRRRAREEDGAAGENTPHKGRGTAYDAPAYRAAYEGQAWHDEGRHDGLQAGDDRRRQRSLFMGRAEGAAEPFDAYRLPLQI
ncbi:hypothetical protein SDC9_117131 [bioreactor metagenome]|uniref:Uncharacterized protein n=1 Tax=bioreactor metagenome TaxID=1076179 RepID=A0A645BYI3_9ZZZZ